MMWASPTRHLGKARMIITKNNNFILSIIVEIIMIILIFVLFIVKCNFKNNETTLSLAHFNTSKCPADAAK
jgi:uncharacterized integral membrane protein